MKRRPKGTGTIEKTRDDRFRARLSFKPGVREDIEGSPFLTYEEAERALDALLFELRSLGATRGTPLARVAERMFAQRHAAGYSAVNGEESRWKTYFEKHDIAKTPVDLLTQGELMGVIQGFRKKSTGLPLSLSTRKALRCLLSGALKLAKSEGLVESNVLDGAEFPDPKGKGAKKRRKRRALSWESFESLWKVSNRSPEIAVAIWTTLRQGEQRALHWADVHNVEGSKCTCEEHRDDPHIFVRYGKPPIAGVDCSPKNGETRVVSLFGEALQALRTMPRKGPIVFVSRLGGYRAKGRLIGRKAWKMWKEASSLPDLRWHSLRHTGCTWLVRGELRMGIHAAWPLEAVKEHAGHSELRTTEIYADQREGAQARLMAEQARNKPAATTGGCAANAAIRNDSEESHLRDLNSRPTVYESHRKPSEVLRLAGLAGLARAYALAVARGATDAHVLGLRLAEAVLDLDIRAQEAAS